MGIFKKIIKKEESENDIPYEDHFAEAMKKIEALFEEASVNADSEEENDNGNYGLLENYGETKENGGENNGKQTET